MGDNNNLLLSLLTSVLLAAAVANGEVVSAFNRTSFPKNFLFGGGIAAYQAEGSPLVDGRGPSVWDKFTKEFPGKIADGSKADVTNDFYHRFKDDLLLAKRIGMDSFRLSISWSRIFPKGKIAGGVNSIGVKFYSDVIDEILANGLIPFVTLLHFDTPQALDDEYGGLRSSNIVRDFSEFADFCFKEFGDRVKNWVTINEPNIVAQLGYDLGLLAPGRCSSYQGNCPVGNSATEPYIVGHNQLLCHAAAARWYKENYQATQKGQIGITIAANWFLPLQNTTADHLAVSRALDFNSGWFIHPVIYGDYPASMKQLVGNRLPTFTKQQSEMLKTSSDFLTINYYTAYYAYAIPSSNGVNASYTTDGLFSSTGFRNGVSVGAQTASSVFFVYPKGLYSLLTYINKVYKNPNIYITENGYAGNTSLPFKQELLDRERISFMKEHLRYILKAIRDGVKVKGYYLWSFTDVWEWNSGYTISFGIIHINRTTLLRTLKASAYWYKRFLLH